MIAIIDAGFGNLASVKNAFAAIGEKVFFASKPKEILSAEKIVLPGVGSFGTAMKMLEEKKLCEPIEQSIFSEKPFLGICIGLQLLFEESEESPGIKGLGILKGKVKKFWGEKIPQIGWNKIELEKKNRLFQGVKNKGFVFFANSFFAEPLENEIVSAKADYGGSFCAAIEKRNLFATQFHPEKSGLVGLKILKNFADVRKCLQKE